MADVVIISAVWYYVIWCLIFILIGLVVFLLFLLHRMKSKMYVQLKEPNETIVTTRTTINSNRFNIQLDYRKDSDRLVRMYDQFTTDESDSASKNNSVEDNASSTKTTVTKDQENSDKSTKIKQAALPSELLRQQLDLVYTELMNSRLKKISVDKDTEESHELGDLKVIRKRVKSLRTSTRVRSKSTTDLDIYDVLPEPKQVVIFNRTSKDDEKYTSIRPGRVIIVNDDSGYQLPLTVQTPYVNSNSK